MKIKLRRGTSSGSAPPEVGTASGRPEPIRAGTRLGSFTEAGLTIEVQVAGERRLWLQHRSSGGTKGVGPIVWNEYRTPSLNPVPDWLDANSWAATVLVLKSTALHRAVMLGELLDPTLGIEVNPELGDLVYQAEPRR
jgi:hypothetical protein